jgi:hypothetical protein
VVAAIPAIITSPPRITASDGVWPSAIQAVTIPATGTSSENGTTEPTG